MALAQRQQEGKRGGLKMGKPPSAAASQNKTGKAGAVARSNTSNMKERQQENEEEDGIDFFLTDINKKP
jgi:hypothetical protein